MIDDLVEIWLLLSFLLRGDMVHYFHSITGEDHAERKPEYWCQPLR